jgi:acyl-coenzyme A synthetase/AMP-(fatty) acid ligase
MKSFLDRLAFVFHRPRFFGKTFTAIVTQGIFGGGSIRKYLEDTGESFGFHVTKGSCVTTLEPMTERQQNRAGHIAALFWRQRRRRIFRRNTVVAGVKILDDDGQEVPTGQQGTVYMLLSQALNFEYKGDAEKTRGNRVGNYFTVGDIGYLNEEGYLFLCDRKIDMIISGGLNIYPAEIEAVLLAHPAVEDAAVFGIPNEEFGEEVKAAVTLRAGHEPAESLTADLIAHCRAHLASYKAPRSIDYETEMPRHETGKLYKRLLRDRYWVGHASKLV